MKFTAKINKSWLILTVVVLALASVNSVYGTIDASKITMYLPVISSDTGSKLTDLSGNGRDAFKGNTVSIDNANYPIYNISGNGIRSLYFDTTANAYVALNTTNDWRFVNNFTVSFWVNCSSGIFGLIGYGNLDTPNGWHIIEVLGTLRWYDGTTGISFTGYSACTEQWQNIVVVRRESVASLYIDGEFKMNVSTSPSLSYDATSMPFLGAVTGTGGTPDYYHLYGSMDEIAVFNTILNDNEIQDLYNYGSVNLTNIFEINSYDLITGDTDGYMIYPKQGEQFIAESSIINNIGLYLKKGGLPEGLLNLKVYTDNSDTIGTLIYDFNTSIDATSLTGTYDWYFQNVHFNNLVVGNKYWLIIGQANGTAWDAPNTPKNLWNSAGYNSLYNVYSDTNTRLSYSYTLKIFYSGIGVDFFNNVVNNSYPFVNDTVKFNIDVQSLNNISNYTFSYFNNNSEQFNVSTILSNLNNSLLAYYSMSDGTDALGVYNMTVTGTIFNSTAIHNLAGWNTIQNQGLTRGQDDSVFNFGTNDFTLDGFYYVESGNDYGLISKFPGGNDGYVVYIDGAGQLHFYGEAGAVNFAGENVIYNKWVYFALRRNSTDCTFFNATQQISTVACNGINFASTGEFQIMSRQDISTVHLIGGMDEVGVWTRALADEEILLRGEIINSSFFPYEQISNALTLQHIQQMPSSNGFFNYTWYVTDTIGNTYQSDLFSLFVNQSISGDQPPTAPTSVVLNDTSIYTNEAVFCNASGSTDPDNDVITYFYKFNKTGITLQDWSTNQEFSCTTSGCNKDDIITCYAKATTLTFNSSETEGQSFTVLNTIPFITVSSPFDFKHGNTNFTAQFIVTDDDLETVACSLYANATLQSSNASVNLGSTTELVSALINEGTYLWYISCSDSNITINSTDRTFYLDTEPPLINFYYPFADNSTITNNPLLQINVSVSDQYLDVTNVTGYCEGKTSIIYTNTTTWLSQSSVTLTDMINFSSCGEGDMVVEVCARDSLSNSPVINDKLTFGYNSTLPVAHNLTINSTNYLGLYSYKAQSGNSVIYFRNNTNTNGAIRFEKDGYYFTYDLSSGQEVWKAKVGQPAATDTLGGGVPSNTQNTQIRYSGNNILYPQAYSNTNITYTLMSNMIKEYYVLYSLPSIKDYLYLEYSGNIQFNKSLKICANGVCFTPSGNQDDFNTSGRIDFKDVNNITRFYLDAPVITDAAGHTTTGIYIVHGSDAQMQFYLRIPTSFIQAATFPIYFDPTIVYTDESTSTSHITLYNLTNGVQIKRTVEYLNNLNVPLSLSTYGFAISDTWFDNGKHLKTNITLNKVDANQYLYSVKFNYECVANCQYMEYLNDRGRSRIIDNNRNLVFTWDDAVAAGWSLSYNEASNQSYAKIMAPSQSYYNSLPSTYSIDPITGGLNTQCVEAEFLLHTTAPNIFFGGTTTNSGLNYQDFIYADVEVIEEFLAHVHLYLYNSSQDLIYNLTQFTAPFMHNFTGLTAGTYYLNATAHDNASNHNNSETRIITLDPMPIISNIVLNATPFQNQDVLISADIVDPDGQGIAFAKLEVKGVNYTMANTFNNTFSVALSESLYVTREVITFYIYAEDNTGSPGFASSSFTVQNYQPTAPSNHSVQSTYLYNQSIVGNTTGLNITFTPGTDQDDTPYQMISFSTIGFTREGTYIFNTTGNKFTNLNLTDGYYYVTLWATDLYLNSSNYNFNLDVQLAPASTIINLTKLNGADHNMTIHWNYQELVNKVLIYRNNTWIANVSYPLTNYYDYPLLANTTYNYTIFTVSVFDRLNDSVVSNVNQKEFTTDTDITDPYFVLGPFVYTEYIRANITFTANEPVTVSIQYGLPGNLNNTATATVATSHNVQLTNFDPFIVDYQYNLTITDTVGKTFSTGATTLTLPKQGGPSIGGGEAGREVTATCEDLGMIYDPIKKECVPNIPKAAATPVAEAASAKGLLDEDNLKFLVGDNVIEIKNVGKLIWPTKPLNGWIIAAVLSYLLLNLLFVGGDYTKWWIIKKIQSKQLR